MSLVVGWCKCKSKIYILKQIIKNETNIHMSTFINKEDLNVIPLFQL